MNFDYEKYLDSLQELVSANAQAAAIIGIALGVINCFFGYKVFKISLVLSAFVALGAIGYGFGQALLENDNHALIVGGVAAVIGALLAIPIYFVALFLSGGFLGTIAVMAANTSAGNENNNMLIIISFVVFGILAIVMEKFFIILSTAFVGAFGIVEGASYFMGKHVDLFAVLKNPDSAQRAIEDFGIQLGLIALLGIVGVVSQYHKKNEIRAHRKAPANGSTAAA